MFKKKRYGDKSNSPEYRNYLKSREKQWNTRALNITHALEENLDKDRMSGLVDDPYKMIDSGNEGEREQVRVGSAEHKKF